MGADLEDFRDDPEFRTKSYNIDSAVNTENFAGTIGGASAIDRIRWEVTEDMLLARRSYQESPGADNRGLPRQKVNGRWEFPTKPTGTIIAAYRIKSHFDIRRGYNSSTGEEMNTIEENTSDRTWNQREYMRVDWSKNLAESTSGDTMWVFGEGTSATPVEYYGSNESERDEDRPHFEVANGYFDITNKYQLKPEPLPGFGVPECVIVGFFNGTTSFDCTPTEVKVRSSYLRLTGDEDFEPFEESNAQRDIVGNWGNAANTFNREYGGPPLTAWDPQYGFTDAHTKTFYSIHNIWEKSHLDVECTSNEDKNKDGTADECEYDFTGYEGNDGSQCDLNINVATDPSIGKCTIPVRDRPVKTMAYWLNADAPLELQDELDGDQRGEPGAIEESTVTWNQLMKTAVAYRREVECRRTGGSREDCHAEYFEEGPENTEMVAFGGWGIQKVIEQDVDVDPKTNADRPIVTTCHNPVRAYDLPLCGEKGEVIRLGDIRKNYAIYWPYASRAPYGGVATIAGDPLTGEMLGVTATIMMRSATYAAASQRDIIQLALGDVNMKDFIGGVQASRYADLVKQGKVAQPEELSRGKTREELEAVKRTIDIASIEAATGESPEALAQMSRDERVLRAAKLQAMSSPQTEGIAKANARLDGLLAKLDATEYKAELANRGLYGLLGQAQSQSNSWVFQSIKAFSENDSSKIQDLMDHYDAYLGGRGVCFHDSINTAGAGSIYQPSLAPYYEKLYGNLSPEERGALIYRDLLRESVKGIAFHEIGHSIGLRHNFASSWDALNYLPQYWQLRTNEGKSTAACDPSAGRQGGPDTCMGPRYLDPATEDEAGLTPGEPRPGIDYFANTSTMEYQIERFGETAGAGLYDMHAMKTLYGRVLETFDANQVHPDEQTQFGVTMLSQGIPSDLVFDPNSGYGLHYTRVAVKAKLFDSDRDCRPATDEEIASAKWRVVHGKICSPPPKNHLTYEDMVTGPIGMKIGKQTAPTGVDGVRWKGVDETGTTLVRWPYRYGEDYSRGGYSHAKMFDSGGDIYETTVNVIKRFDATYPWSYFRRQNKEFSWWAIPNSIANSTFARLRGYHWNTTTDISRNPKDIDNDNGIRPSFMASNEMFNFLQRVILTPEPGLYADDIKRTPPRAGALRIFDALENADEEDTGGAGRLGIVDGRFIQVDFDNVKGGSWDYFHFPNHAGFDEEKVLALRELVDSRATLSTISRDNALDGRDPYISFRTDVPHALDRLLGGMLSEDWETIGPSMNADGQSHSVFSLLDKDATRLTRPADSRGILFPNIGYANQLGTGIYAILLSRFSSDMGLTNKLRIRFEGDRGFTIPDDRKAAFTDPVSGQRYVALKFGTETIQGRAVEKGIASRMLQRANELLAAAYGISGAPNAYGEYIVGADAQPTGASADKALRRYIGLLDAMRQVNEILSDGPL